MNNDPSGQSRLKHHHVRVRYEDEDQLRDRWTVYDCLVWETDFEDNKYVLFDGRWFEVEPNYASRVTEYVDALVSEEIEFPGANGDQDEEAYNAAVEHAFPDTYALLDRVEFLPTGAATRIEFCDLLSSSRQFIHVKPRTGSATLSHLFSQGSVSSRLFLQDQGLRDSVRATLAVMQKAGHVALIPADRPTAAEYEVVYAIIARANQNGEFRPLPFFSAVNIMHHAGLIRNLGFRVSLQYIRLT
jgi:uncharacterized protein (TIGR04141 family)